MSSFAGLLGFMAIPSWSRLRHEDRLTNAKRHAEVLGYQIFEIYREASAEQSPEVAADRGPASVDVGGGAEELDVGLVHFRESGSIGNDPWGQPYRYKILDSIDSQIRIQIWSAGPNRHFETADEPGLAADRYQGDDVGVLLALNHSPKK